jgi:hypothetical protein
MWLRMPLNRHSHTAHFVLAFFWGRTSGTCPFVRRSSSVIGRGLIISHRHDYIFKSMWLRMYLNRHSYIWRILLGADSLPRTGTPVAPLKVPLQSMWLRVYLNRHSCIRRMLLDADALPRTEAVK